MQAAYSKYEKAHEDALRTGLRRFDSRQSLFFFIFSLVSFFFFSPLFAQKWEEQSEYRVEIKKSKKSRWPAETGYVLLYPGPMDSGKARLKISGKSGKDVGHQILWASNGEPLKVLFDTSSGDTSYWVCVSRLPFENAVLWEPTSGLFLETRPRKEGEIGSLAQVKKRWEDAGAVHGRSLVSHVFHGTHLHGVPLDFLSHYHGFFQASQDGEYLFATVSDDASFLLVNGKEVASWPGWHDVGKGRRGEHHGTIFLTKGRHRLEYFHVQGMGTTVTLAAWMPPGHKRLQVISPQNFSPVATFETIAYEGAPGKEPHAFFEWEMEGHCMVDDMALIYTRFEAVPCKARPHASGMRLSPEDRKATIRLSSPEGRKKQEFRWTFDDGDISYGERVRHLYLKPGLRSVTLEILENEEICLSLTRQVHVHPRWEQAIQWPEKLFKEQWVEVMSKNLYKASPDDLAYFARFSARIEDVQWMEKAADATLKGREDFSRAHAPDFYYFATVCMKPGVNRHGLAEKALQLVLRIDSTKPMIHRARLQLAFLLEAFKNDPDEAKRSIQGLDVSDLDPSERKRLTSLQADLEIGKGEIEKARHLFSSIAPRPSKNHVIVVRHKGKLEIAKDLVRRREYALANEMLQEIEEESPMEKLDPALSFVRLSIFLGRKEYLPALSVLRKLVHLATTERQKAFCLMHEVEIRSETGDEKGARQAFSKLIDEYPHAEAASLAKEKWGEKF